MTKHLQRDSRTGRLSFRRAYPVELRPFIPKSPRELKRSLGATSLRYPETLRRFADANTEYQRTVQAARLKAEGSSRPLTGADIDFLVQTYVHRLRKNLTDTHFDLNDENREWLGASAWRYAPLTFMDGIGADLAGREAAWKNSERIREALPALIDGWKRLRADGDRLGIIEAEGQTAEDLLSEFALRAGNSDPLFFDLCHVLLIADIATGEQLSGLVGEGRDIEPVALPASDPRPFAAQEPPVSEQATDESMQSLAEQLLAQKVDPVGTPTAQSWATALRFWRETHGDLSCAAIKRKHVSEWLDLVRQRPVSIPRREQRLPLPALVERYSGDAKVKRLAGKTVFQHLTSLQAVWNKSAKRGLIEGLTNPFSQHEVRVENKPGGNPLTIDELDAVFRLPVFTEGERPLRGRGEAAYWIPLFALFTGARPGEIAQLIVSDFWQDGSGKWFMRYTDDGEHPAIGKRHLKTSRHGTGSRQFPVPQTLVALGLPEYLSWLNDRGETAFFPEIRANSKGLHDTWSRWWGPYVREHGAIDPAKRQTREFRHNFTTAARESGISGEAISYLIGHSILSGPTTLRYGDHAPYGVEIEKLGFEGLDLTGVKHWTPPA